MTVTDFVRIDRRPAIAARRAVAARAEHPPALNWVRTYRLSLVLGDLVGATTAVLVAMATTRVSAALIVLPVVWAVIASLTGAYRAHVLSAGSHDLRAVLLTGVIMLALMPVLEVTGLAVPDRTAIAAILAITGVASLVRFGARMMISARRRVGQCVQRVVVVGEAEPVTEMVERLRRATKSTAAVAVVVPPDQLDRVRKLGLPAVAMSDTDPEATVAAAGEHLADAVLLVPGGGIATPVWRGIARACEWHGLQLMFTPAVVDVATSAPVIPVAGVPVLAVPRPGPAGAGQVAKQVVDRVGAGVGLLLLLPMLAALALAVRLDSHGPVLFRQTRVGQNGREFTIFKFRTMRIDAERVLDDIAHLNESEGPLFKLQNDPRVTRVGRVLRKLSLDELPQLVNVVLGHMSLVGPRPPLPREVATYTRAERRRLLVKPGLTGLWQVGGRSTLNWAEAVQLDIRYVESWSLPLDLRILARTLPAVARGTGAF